MAYCRMRLLILGRLIGERKKMQKETCKRSLELGGPVPQHHIQRAWKQQGVVTELTWRQWRKEKPTSLSRSVWDKKYPQNPRGEKHKSNLSWLNWNTTRQHDIIPVEKLNFKIASVIWSKMRSGTQQDVPTTCHVVIWRRKVQPFYVFERRKLRD